MKKSLLVSAIAVALLSGCDAKQSAHTTQAQTPLFSDTLVVSPADDRQYQTLTLENGIEVILVSDPKVDKSSAALSVGVGLLHDPMTQQGMAHYLEHMLFLGTERYPDSNEYGDFMTQNGGATNASTWLDITKYMFKVNNDAYDEALDRFSDFFKAPKLYPEYTEKEKNAVNAEWSMRREMDFFGQFKLARKMMEGHPADRFLIGNLETLGDKEGSNLHQETVAFFEKYYSANIMKVALLSNRPLSEMTELAKKHFASIENKNIADPEVTEQVDLSKVGKKRVYYKPNQDVKQLNIEFLIKNNQADFALKPNAFISYLFNSEMPGTPAQILRDKGWVSSLSSYGSPTMYGNYGVFSINASLTDEGMKHRKDIEAVIMQYLELVKREGANSKYFDEIRTSLNNQFTFLEKGDEFAYVSALSESMQNYPVNHAINAPYHYAKFDAEAIERVLSQLTPETMKIWYISQQEETDSELYFYDGKYRIADITDEEVAAWQQTEVTLSLPAVNRLLPESFAIKTDKLEKQDTPTLAYDENGIKIWRMASQLFANQPKGEIDVYINNDAAIESIDADVMLSLWASIYNQQQTALRTEASTAGMSFSLSPAAGVILSVGGFTDKQSDLIKTAVSALDIEFTEQEFNQAVDRYTRGLANQGKAFPFRQAFNALLGMVRSGNYDNKALIQRAKALKASDLSTFIKDQLNQNQVRAFAFGNYDDADTAHLATVLKEALPKTRKVTEFAKRTPFMPEVGKQFVLQQDIDVADVAVVDYIIHPEAGYKAKAAASVLQSHFRTTMFDKLRTEEQLAYAVGGFARPLGEFAGFGLYIQTPVKAPGDMQARFDAFKAEYSKVLADMDDATFSKLKQSALVALNEKPKNLASERAPLVEDWYRENMAFDSKDQLISEVEKVTLNDLKAFYQQTMMNPSAPRVNIQLRGNKFADQAFATLEGAEVVEQISAFHDKVTFQK